MHIGGLYGGKTLQALLACNMAFLEVGKIAFSGTPGIVDYMRTHHLLAVQQNCGRCAVAMRVRRRADFSDGAGWWYPPCKTRKSIRSGSFFEKSHRNGFSFCTFGPVSTQ